MELGPADRVLLLTMPALEEVRAIAIQVPEGLVVGVLDGDSLYQARAELRDLPNVMITPSDPEEKLPWRDGFFNAVYAPGLTSPTAEMLRVVMPGGTLLVAGGPVLKG
jgi:hypothetical protein